MVAPNTRFNSRKIASQLVVSALLPRIEIKAKRVVDLIGGPLDLAVKGFFLDLASYMGSTEDLASRLPAVDGLRPWLKLAPEYIRRKGTSAFWIYSLLPKVNGVETARTARILQAQRGIVRKKLSKRELSSASKKLKTDSLIPSLMRIDGLAALGGAEITMIDFFKRRVILKQPQERQTFSATRVRGKNTQVYSITRLANVPDVNIKALSFQLNIKLFTNFRKSHFNTIESRLADNGSISKDNASKLIGRGGYQRPLIAPFLSYYSSIKLPELIRQVLEKHFGVIQGVNNVRITSSSATGNADRSYAQSQTAGKARRKK